MKQQLTFKHVLGMFNTVVSWNACAGNLPEDKTLTEVYRQLTLAEYEGKGEFLEGFQTHNNEMILDGIGDLTYTSFFWAATEGMCESKLKDLYEIAEGCVTFGEATLHGTVELLKFYLESDYGHGFVKELLVIMLLFQKEYNLVESFEAISESNFSKFPKVEDVEDPEKELEIILDKGRYVGLDYKEFEGRYIFTAMQDLQDDVRFDKPKIIKSGQFQEPEDLTQFVYK